MITMRIKPSGGGLRRVYALTLLARGPRRNLRAAVAFRGLRAPSCHEDARQARRGARHSSFRSSTRTRSRLDLRKAKQDRIGVGQQATRTELEAAEGVLDGCRMSFGRPSGSPATATSRTSRRSPPSRADLATTCWEVILVKDRPDRSGGVLRRPRAFLRAPAFE